MDFRVEMEISVNVFAILYCVDVLFFYKDLRIRLFALSTTEVSREAR